MEDFLAESTREAPLSIVMMSHLSDAEVSCGEKEKEHIEFVKFLILKYGTKEIINQDSLWNEFKTRK